MGNHPEESMRPVQIVPSKAPGRERAARIGCARPPEDVCLTAVVELAAKIDSENLRTEVWGERT